jgi:hypothetical protein
MLNVELHNYEVKERQLRLSSNWLMGIACVLLWPCIYFFMLWKVDVIDQVLPGGHLIALLTGMLLGVLPFYILFYQGRKFSERSNIVRRQRFIMAAKCDQRPPFLLLRRFDEWGLAFRPRSGHGGRTSNGKSYLPDLAKALSTKGVVLGIGGLTNVADYYSETDTLHYQVDDASWENVFLYIADSAKAIVIIPGTSPGVSREIEILNDRGFLQKTLVFMPPTPSNKGRTFFKYLDLERVAEEWETVRKFWREKRGFDFPKYNVDGMLFSVGPMYQKLAYITIDRDCSPLVLSKAVEELLPRNTTITKPVSEIIPEIDRWEVPLPSPNWFNQLMESG